MEILDSQKEENSLQLIFQSNRGKQKDFLESRELSRSEILSRNQAYFLTDFRNFRFGFLSERLKEMLQIGRSSAEFGIQHYYDMVHPDDKLIIEQKGIASIKNHMKNLKGISLDQVCLELFYRISVDGIHYFPVLQTVNFIEFDVVGRLLTGFSSITNLGSFVNLNSFCFAINATRENYSYQGSMVEKFEDPPVPEPIFTKREKQILQWLSIGYSSKMIGNELGISKHTVDTHRRNMLEKMQMNSSAQLVRYAIETGVLETTREIGPRR